MHDAGRSIRAASGRLAADWADGSRARRIAMILAGALGAALIGAFLFGVWHVLFGGFVKGNWRAGAFGIALAGISAGLLAVGAAVARRVFGSRSGG